ARRTPACERACAIAQEIERLLATPTISPCLPERVVMVVNRPSSSVYGVRRLPVVDDFVMNCGGRSTASASCPDGLADRDARPDREPPRGQVRRAAPRDARRARPGPWNCPGARWSARPVLSRIAPHDCSGISLAGLPGGS